MRIVRSLVPFLVLGGVAACSVATPEDAPASESTDRVAEAWNTGDLRPNGKGFITKNAAGKGGGKTSAIQYHGGPVMLGNVNVYYVLYGNWSDAGAVAILEDFAKNVGGSPYEDINTTYYDGSGNHVSGQVTFGKSVMDAYSHGTALADADVQAVVASHIASGELPSDSNGIYLVLTSADVNETSGFCTQYCGWHDRATIGGADIKYGFVGDADRCPSACSPQTVGPNGNAGADAMVSIIAHETEEAISDPDLNAWYDRRGQENADKCAWTFGTTQVASNGAKYNITLGSRSYLVQQNWVNSGSGFCALHL